MARRSFPTPGAPALLLCAVFALVPSDSGSSAVQTAVNITWSSINFKTLLHWDPKPVGYFYTVEMDGDLLPREKVCIRTAETKCDVTNVIFQNLKDTYMARIYSEIPYDEDNFETPPYELSSEFVPYTQTVLGTPTVTRFEQKDEILKVEVADPLTPHRVNGTLQTIRDIFKNDLEYLLHYWKDQSTGKKSAKTKTNQFTVGVDKGKSYCFYVEANIPSRLNNQKSQKSSVKCTSVHREDLDALDWDKIVIIVAAAVGVLILIIVSSVVIYKCKKAKSRPSEKEYMPQICKDNDMP
ncbi:tissue factor [Thamnophis elegans]|uniref:tissue factor n=1 Tax=Thamnophis elegans TaxID=35005 RepID=UPI001376FDF8|nr:tissue factor [Thamnophis elegans]